MTQSTCSAVFYPDEDPNIAEPQPCGLIFPPLLYMAQTGAMTGVWHYKYHFIGPK